MVVEVLCDGPHFVGRSIAGDFANPDRGHIQSSRRPGHPLHPQPNPPDK
jgi:hypothetical protein